MEGLEEWLPPVSAGTKTGLQIAQVRELAKLLIKSRPDPVDGKRRQSSRLFQPLIDPAEDDTGLWVDDVDLLKPPALVGFAFGQDSRHRIAVGQYLNNNLHGLRRVRHFHTASRRNHIRNRMKVRINFQFDFRSSFITGFGKQIHENSLEQRMDPSRHGFLHSFAVPKLVVWLFVAVLLLKFRDRELVCNAGHGFL